MRNFVKGCLISVLLLSPVPAWATHPFEVEDTNTQGKGNYLFELDGDYIKDNSLRTTDLSGVLRAGASAHTDFVLSIPYFLLNPSVTTNKYERGIGDVQLALKYRINENEVGQSAGFQVFTSLPSGNVDKGLGTNNVVWGVTFMDQQECHNNVLHVSAGYETYGRDIKKWHYATNFAFKFGFALEHKFAGSLSLLTELAGEFRKTTDPATEAQFDSKPFTFMTGFRYDISKTWYVDLAARAGLNKYAEDYTGLVGTAWRF